jgi:dihydropteroate synthase
VNDVSAGRDDPDLLALAGERGAGVVLMHMLGKPKTMQEDPHYENVLADVRAFLAERIDQAVAAGVPQDNCIVDPGIGFGKTVEHNLQLLAGVGQLCGLGRPVLIGASRKRFIGAITGEGDPGRRLGGSLAATCAAYWRGATIFRVHDVAPTVQALAMLGRIEQAGQTP